MIFSFLFVLLVPLVWSLEILPTLRVDLQPPEEYNRLTSRNVSTSWITMPIDHFDPQNTDTFQMRFMYNEDLFGGPGYPVFILVGGEWTIAEGWLRGGNMYLMAEENRGYQIYTEHRYYGQTLPYENFTAENLRFLNVDQALADLAFFINDLKKQPRFAESKIILYGGSYAGNMVLWFKQRYPHLALGVVASSAPIAARLDFTGYLEVVHDALLSEGGDECISILRQGISDTAAALQTEDGRHTIQTTYRFCNESVFDFDNPFDLGYFSGAITWRFSGQVQTASPGTLRNLCNNFINNVYGTTPMEQIAGYLVGQSCLNVNFNILLNAYSQNNNNRAWYFQTCTEYAYFQTAPRSGTIFDPLIWVDVPFYSEVCKRIFDIRYDESFTADAIDRVNLIFGGTEPNVNNTINIHGNIDPWHVLGVYDRDIKASSPTYTIPRASHCFDMQNWLITDTIEMTQTKNTARRIVSSWLSDN
ncbi:putative serine protease K12H4.7 [Galleria mellonella]|uniref:Serine protease K12H4.7 n=1 Tax=Galleria mellonella TaxID=7137 RepID=A0A6J1WLS4_GALME|nr:putative serine protease K12H4.7 [Galleria mellonella]